MSNTANRHIGAIERASLVSQYRSFCGKLEPWRIDPEFFDARKSVLPFVVGLRFSALLIYNIRRILNGTNFRASWGTIVSEDGKRCSPECDIIIHENRWLERWNGDDENSGPIMDFRFIESKNAKLVISCKSSITQIDQKYLINVSEYIDKVWLFCEYCNPTNAKSLRQRAKEAGYSKFWYLYLLDSGIIVQDDKIWLGFVDSLKRTLAE